MNMDRITFEGPFAESIAEHISLKQALGYKYVTESKSLSRFASFTQRKYPDAQSLTREIVLDWCAKKSYESQTNQCARATLLRQLAIFMDRVGEQAYILPKGYYPTEAQYVPYIFTKDELNRFFSATDQCFYVSECPDRHFIMPLYYRMIYTCGLRPQEARLLKKEDVDLDQGIITIHHSKKDVSRLVPMSVELTDRCRQYSVNVRFSPSNWFFPGLEGKPMTRGNAYHNFRRFLWKAGISHGGRGKGPRIYDFRHTFACHCLKKWVLEGKDLNAYLPILKTYMGHDSFEDTAYYLRLTADVFPDIIIKLEGCYPNIVPLIEGHTHAAH